MPKNILKAFVAHVLIVIIAWLLMKPFAPYADDKMNLGIQIYLVVLSIVIAVMYIWAGTRLQLQTSPRRNWLSAMALTVPGLILWLSFTAIHGDLEWVLFYLYYYSMAPFGTLAAIQSKSVGLVFNFVISLVPFVLMGLGLEWRRRRIKIH